MRWKEKVERNAVSVERVKFVENTHSLNKSAQVATVPLARQDLELLSQLQDDISRFANAAVKAAEERMESALLRSTLQTHNWEDIRSRLGKLGIAWSGLVELARELELEPEGGPNVRVDDVRNSLGTAGDKIAAAQESSSPSDEEEAVRFVSRVLWDLGGVLEWLSNRSGENAKHALDKLKHALIRLHSQASEAEAAMPAPERISGEVNRPTAIPGQERGRGVSPPLVRAVTR